MKHNFLNEFKDEKDFFVSKFEDIGWEMNDHILCKKMGFIVNPSAKNEDWKCTVPIYFYPSFLSYYGDSGECLEMWVECRVYIEHSKLEVTEKESEGAKEYWDNCRDGRILDYKRVMDVECAESSVDTIMMLAKQLTDEIKKIGWHAFKDEDAYLNYFTRPEYKNGRASISFYLNKDYPNGFWENHTL